MMVDVNQALRKIQLSCLWPLRQGSQALMLECLEQEAGLTWGCTSLGSFDIG